MENNNNLELPTSAYEKYFSSPEYRDRKGPGFFKPAAESPDENTTHCNNTPNSK
jgi:hypothetical protein